MKTGSYAAALGFFSAFSLTFVQADWISDYKANVPEDPYAVPAAFEPKPKEPTQEEKDERKEALEKARQNQDWLVRGYEQQLQARSTEQGDTDKDNLYAQLSQDKDLAKAAGLPVTEAPDYTKLPDLVDLHTAAVTKTTADLRPDPALHNTNSPSPEPSTQSFITPLSSVSAIQGQTPYSSLPPLITASTPMGFDLTHTSPNEQNDSPALASSQLANLKIQDAGSMDIPGMTAAENNPEAEPLDEAMPEEAMAEQKNQHNSTLELPVASNADRLQQLQDSSLVLPGEKPKKALPISVNSTNLSLKAHDDTDQMVPDPTPLRNRPDDPFDILR